MGADPLEAAEIEMWQRRVECELLAPVAAVLRHGNSKMAVIETQCLPWAEANRPRVVAGLRALETRLAAKPFVAGPRFTIADITALVAIDFMRAIRTRIPADCAALSAWHASVSARPSAAA